MEKKKTKAVIIGAGAVGASVAFDLCIQGLCDEIVLIDINRDKAFAEALDIQHSSAYQSRNVKIIPGDYPDCGDADIIILTAAVPYIPGQRRLDMAGSAAKIVRSVVPQVMASGFSGHFIVVTNPVDVMAYLVYSLSGLPKNQIIGTGTSLDSARLRGMIADLLGVDPKSVQAYTMGEHGDSQFIPWSRVSVGGKAFADILSENRERFGDVNLEHYEKEIREVAFRIGSVKGTTNYAIAAAVVEIIKIILGDENRAIPVSALLDGEFGETGVFVGVPAILNSRGVREIIEVHLTPEEQHKLHRSASILKEVIGDMGL